MTVTETADEEAGALCELPRARRLYFSLGVTWGTAADRVTWL